MNIQDIYETLRRIDGVLEKADFPYQYTGGIVVTYYGQPRLTQDVDVVVGVAESEVADFLETIGESYQFDLELVQESSRSHQMFQVLDLITYYKIDFHLGEKVPGSFSRTTMATLFGEKEFPIVSKEDAIVSKVLWASKGSTKSRMDIAMMLAEATPFSIDLVEKLCTQLGIHQVFEQIHKDFKDGTIDSL